MRVAKVVTISPSSFSPDSQNAFSGAISARSGLNMLISGYQLPLLTSCWLMRLSSAKSCRSRSRKDKEPDRGGSQLTPPAPRQLGHHEQRRHQPDQRGKHLLPIEVVHLTRSRMRRITAPATTWPLVRECLYDRFSSLAFEQI